MLQPLKKYYSVLLLAIFLFPLAEKEVHALEHRSDFHCSSADQHFHELEHNCEICDFILSSSDGSPEILPSLYLFAYSFSYRPAITCVYELNTIDQSGSRAPPVA
jgi:hypothetical protein